MMRAALISVLGSSRAGGKAARALKRITCAALLFLAAAMLVAALPAMAAAADVTISNVYVGGQSGEYGTMSIDLTTGVSTFTSIGTTTDSMAGLGLGSDGKLYGLAFPGGNLIQFTNFTSSAATTNLGSTGFTAAAGATNSSGVMFGLDSQSPSNLFKTTPPSISGSLVGNTGLSGPSGMAAFSNTGVLFASNTETSGNNNLYTLNTGTGAATLIGTMFSNGASITAGTFATASDGTVHLIGFESNGGNNLYDINTTTGAVTLIGSYSFGQGNTDQAFAAAFAPTTQRVPEPATLVLLGGMGVLGLGFRALRKRTAIA
jgi:hypothetical protein